ncbi:MAG: hypothetical protein Q8Q60_03755 [Candidatus Chromulinivorax sp.]|nr:hypothetical protein [Candidatus Chromulinivorax sp.]
MKKLQIIALTMLFALIGVESLIHAKGPCPAGQKRNAQGKCVKKSRVNAANKAKKEVKKAIDSNFRIEQIARNAIIAFNTNISKASQHSVAAQKAAVTAINNVITMYNGYLAAAQKGIPVVFGENQLPAQSMSGAPYAGFAAEASTPANAYVSSCGDGSTATCMFDGTEIVGIDCGDGTKSDNNGMCSDGSLVTCNDGSQPLCGDYTSPY